MRAVIRADAGAALGGGHVMRCAVLAAVLAEFGWDIGVAARPGTRPSAERLDAVAAGWFELPADCADEPAAMRGHWPDGADLLITDHYEWGGEQESACRGWAKAILSIDDLADRRRDCDFVLNTTPGITPEHYAGLLPDDAVLLAGPDFALVDEAFARMRTRSAGAKTGAPRLYINYGLSDPVNATTIALEAVARLKRDIPVQVVIGPACPFAEEIARAAADVRAAVRINPAGRAIAGMMGRAGIALGAAGTSSWERCCLGLPAVVSIIAPNQEPNARALAARDAALVIPPGKTLSVGAIAEELSILMDDPERRAVIAANAAALCDGLGARRAALALTPFATASGERVTLRPVLPRDGEIMFAWQSDPASRKFARNPAPPARDEHFAWFEAKQRDPDAIFNIVLCGGEPSGVFRLDRLSDDSYEVSILIAPDKHGSGLGGAALDLGRRLLPWAEYHAHVHAENAPSHAIFRRAGYVWQGDHYVSAPLRKAA